MSCLALSETIAKFEEGEEKGRKQSIWERDYE